MRFYEVADSKAGLDSLDLDFKPFLDSVFTLDFTLGLPLAF